MVADGLQHRAVPPSSSSPPPPFSRMPMLSEEDDVADAAGAALVSDGGMRSQSSESALPPYPYRPGSARMPGHADESNEMRLSGYVKGETRAQNMKDSGQF